jgi:hypothetical protein
MESDHSRQRDFEANSHSTDQVSHTPRSQRSDSKRTEDELFKELENMNEKCDPIYFQSEIKRFGTGSLKQSPEEITQTEQEQDPKKVVPSSLRRKSSVSGRKQVSKKIIHKKPPGIMDQVLWKRKACRLATLICCISFTIIVLVSAYMLGMNSMSLQVDLMNKNLVINLSNCRLFLGPCESNICEGKAIYLSFLRSINNIMTPSLYRQAGFGHQLQGDRLQIDVNHLDEQRGCNLHVDLDPDTVLASLAINCNTSCSVIQRRGQLTVTEFNATAQTMNLNFLKLKTEQANINVNWGFVQLNELELGSAKTSNISVLKGDIVIQSVRNLRVAFTSVMENYCFASKVTKVVALPTQGAISPYLLASFTYQDFERNRFKSQWSGIIDLCNSTTTCSSSPSSVLNLTNVDGNLYVNILDDVKSSVDGNYTITKGSSYTSRVKLPFEANKSVTAMEDLTIQSSLPNLIVRFVFGNGDAWSSHASHWVYVNHPLYAIMKPWWLSFFTLGKLVENSNDVKTYLSPGFCPYRHTLSKDDHFQISMAIGDILPFIRGVACYQKHSEDPLIPNIERQDDGFQNFPTFTQFSDEWVQVKEEDRYHDIYKAIYLTEVTPVFLIMCLTILLATIASLKLTYSFVGLLFKNFHQIRRRLYHQELYWSVQGKMASSKRKDNIQLEADEDVVEKTHNQTVVKNYHTTLKKKYLELPSTMVFVDHMINQLWTSRSASVRRFYNNAFQKITYQELSELDRRDSQAEKIPLKKLTSLYQQMCFILNYEEADLTTPEHVEYLQDKGMMLTYGDTRRHYLIRLTMPANADLSLNFIKLEKKTTSLHLFLDKFCEKTDFDEDRIAFDYFMERYNLFCKLNHLELVLIDLIILKNKFGIESKTLLREVVERDYDQLHTRDTHTADGFFEKLFFRLRHYCLTKSYYTLKAERAKNINLFLAGKLIESDVGKREFKVIVETTILSRYWWIKDFIAIFLELLIGGLLSIPFITLFIFQEIEHSNYSLRSELLNIYGFNTLSSDIWLVPSKVPQTNLGSEEPYSADCRNPFCNFLVFCCYYNDRKHY